MKDGAANTMGYSAEAILLDPTAYFASPLLACSPAARALFFEIAIRELSGAPMPPDAETCGRLCRFDPVVYAACIGELEAARATDNGRTFPRILRAMEDSDASGGAAAELDRQSSLKRERAKRWRERRAGGAPETPGARHGGAPERATGAPSERATGAPSERATGAPSGRATGAPSERATGAPSERATGAPSERATGAPSGRAGGASGGALRAFGGDGGKRAPGALIGGAPLVPSDPAEKAPPPPGAGAKGGDGGAISDDEKRDRIKALADAGVSSPRVRLRLALAHPIPTIRAAIAKAKKRKGDAGLIVRILDDGEATEDAATRQRRGLAIVFISNPTNRAVALAEFREKFPHLRGFHDSHLIDSGGFLNFVAERFTKGGAA